MNFHNLSANRAKQQPFWGTEPPEKIFVPISGRFDRWGPGHLSPKLRQMEDKLFFSSGSGHIQRVCPKFFPGYLFWWQ